MLLLPTLGPRVGLLGHGTPSCRCPPTPVQTMFVKVQHHGVINHHPTVVAAVKVRRGLAG